MHYNRDELNEIWKKTVHSENDAYEFFVKYHPEFPDAISRAYASYFSRGVKGEIEIPAKYKGKADESESKRWDWRKELND